MKFKISLRLLLVASFVSLGLVLIGAYSIISKEYFIRGLDATMAKNMEEAATTFISMVDENKRHQGAEFSGFFIADEWQAMPDYLHQAFMKAPQHNNILLKADDSGWFSHPHKIVFLMRYHHNNQTLFISTELQPPKSLSVVAQSTVKQNKEFQLMASLLVLALVIIIAWLLLRHVSRPISRLREWTHSLDSQKLSHPVPDFSYPELNDMAELIRSSLDSVQQAVEREKRFLRYASHELRTPISTIRNNVELQRKLSLKAEKTAAEQAIVDRIDRASLTMQHLTETLLWLNHEPDTPIRTEQTDLALLIGELADEMSYLLLGKPVTVRLETGSFLCSLPPTPARIVIGNLIRNAFQHCWQGEVLIQQHGNQLTISNPASATDEHEQSTDAATSGYGLGLQLTAQLTRHLGWDYHHQLQNGEYEVTLRLECAE